MRRLGRLLGVALVVGATALLLVLGVGPRTGRYRTVTVLTGSMRPAMPEGSVVASTPVPLDRLRVGDVVTYRIPVEDRRLVTHRIVRIVRPGDRPVVVTKGDANAEPDPWVAELTGSQAWRARLAVPKLGYVLEDLRSPPVRKVALPVVCALLALLWVRDIWREGDETPETGAVSLPAALPAVRPVRATAVLAALLYLGATRAQRA